MRLTLYDIQFCFFFPQNESETYLNRSEIFSRCICLKGGLVLAAFDQVPWELHDNSIILGCLSFFVALVMLYDLADPVARLVTDTTQTDEEHTMPQQNQQQQQLSQQQVVSATDVVTTNTSTVNQSTQSNQSDIPASGQTNQVHRTDITDKPIDNTESVVREKVTTQNQTVQKTGNPTMLEDIAQNGHYHQGDTIDFVHYQQMPQAQQPVFERVLLPEKKRPTYYKVANSHTATTVQNMRTDDYIPRETHFDATMNYNQMPTYAAIQRQQRQPTISTHPHLDHSSSYQPSSPMYKLNHNYEHNDYEQPPPKRNIINDYGRSSRKHKIQTMRSSDELSRYHDTATEHYQNQPMMIIRNYGHSTPTRPSTATVQQSSIAEHRHHHTNDSVYHRNGNIGASNSSAHITQMKSHRNGCSESNTGDEVDFRKYHAEYEILITFSVNG